MITIKTNIPAVTKNILAKIEKLRNKDYLLLPVAIEIIPMMTERIHERGEDAEGTQIGTYSNGYLRLRQKKYNRSADKKIIVSLTRQMENDWSVIATPNGYGVGFKNPFNLQKARWVEEIKDKDIFSLSGNERVYVVDRIQELANDVINS